MIRKLVFCMICLIALSLLDEAHALKSTKNQGELDPKSFYNPKEDKGDLELPMPNGLKFILRPVAIATTSLLNDVPFKMGVASLSSPERSVYEKQMEARIGAPFLYQNLPNDWQKKLAADKDAVLSYYFLGKYELTNGQWDAVMGENSGNGEEAQKVANGDSSDKSKNLPKTDISWYDIQNFLSKYNEWLLANHPDKLPKIDGVPAFLRLPTEAEWEFAARGGNLARDADGKDFVDNKGHGDGVNVGDYAVFGANHEKAMPIGSRTPNILGIYDMAGNVSELVGDGFRFTISDAVAGGGHVKRLHGSEGGFISKGGSFASKEKSDVYPGRRIEAPMFIKKDGKFVLSRDNTRGVRLALASLNVPGRAREKALLAEETRQGKGVQEKKDTTKQKAEVKIQGEKIVIDPNGDPVVELEKILAVTPTDDMKTNLTQLQALLKDVNEAFSRERDENLTNSLRSVAYMADSLSNIAFRCFNLNESLNEIKAVFPNLSEKDKQEFKKNEQKYVNEINRFFKNLQKASNIYRINVSELGKYSSEQISTKIRQLKTQYQGNDKLNENMRKNLDALQRHISLVSQKGTGALPDIMIWEQVVPGKKSLDLLKKLTKEQAGQKKSSTTNIDEATKAMENAKKLLDDAKNYL